MTRRLAYLGPEGTFTHRASLQVDAGERLPVRSIRAVFEALTSGESDLGVVPAENVSEGAVDETLDLLLASSFVVAGEIVLPIEHQLLGHPGRPVRRVYSHPQALRQCDAWLREHLPDAERVECVSTGEAAALAAGDPDGAAIGPGRRAGLDTLATGLAKAGNQTRFFVLDREPAAATGRDRALVAFGAPHQPGALHACLAPFASSGVNLSRIESRPSRNQAWTYHFIVEVEGHPSAPPLSTVLEDLGRVAEWIKVLGAWPVPSSPAIG